LQIQERLESEIVDLRAELRKLHDISRQVIGDNQRSIGRYDHEGRGRQISDGEDEDLTEWGRRQLGNSSDTGGGRHKGRSLEYEFAGSLYRPTFHCLINS